MNCLSFLVLLRSWKDIEILAPQPQIRVSWKGPELPMRSAEISVQLITVQPPPQPNVSEVLIPSAHPNNPPACKVLSQKSFSLGKLT